MDDLDDLSPDDIEDRRWLDLSLATVVGHTKTATALRERVRAGRHNTGIILHGPKGVGKRTLARLYARAAFCDDPTEAGEACQGYGECCQCRSFIASRPIGYTWFDALKFDDEKKARELVKTLNEGSLSVRQVVVIANADHCKNGTFDALLKTLEEPSCPITFILLARSLAQVRLAGQSRCELYRLRPLALEETREHLRATLSAAATRVDEGVVEVLAVETGGRVGAMHTVVQTVAALPVATLTSVRAALGHDWVEGVVNFWRTALSANEPSPKALVPPASDDARQVQRRVQSVLLRLRPPDVAAVATATATATHAPEAALVHQDAILRELSGILEARAAASGRSTSDLWCALARLWLSKDHGDTEGLRDAARATGRILIPAT